MNSKEKWSQSTNLQRTTWLKVKRELLPKSRYLRPRLTGGKWPPKKRRKGMKKWLNRSKRWWPLTALIVSQTPNKGRKLNLDWRKTSLRTINLRLQKPQFKNLVMNLTPTYLMMIITCLNRNKKFDQTRQVKAILQDWSIISYSTNQIRWCQTFKMKLLDTKSSSNLMEGITNLINQ